MFDKLYIYNFFPTEIGEAEVNLKRITGIKKLLFNAIFGEDTKVLTGDETLGKSFSKRISVICMICQRHCHQRLIMRILYMI